MLWYRGTVGPIARVYGPGGASGRPRRRVATRVSILSGIGKKDDLKAKILLLQHAKSAQKFAARAIDANRAVVAAMHPPDAGTARLARVDGFPRT
mgnify:CR=1 FL=1